MLKFGKETIRTDKDMTVLCKSVKGYAELNGNSSWDVDNNYPKGTRVNVSKIEVDIIYNNEIDISERDIAWIYLNVYHDANWWIYTDSGFVKSISDLFGCPIRFTEQGMQKNGIASMEPDNDIEFIKHCIPLRFQNNLIKRSL